MIEVKIVHHELIEPSDSIKQKQNSDADRNHEKGQQNTDNNPQHPLPEIYWG